MKAIRRVHALGWLILTNTILAGVLFQNPISVSAKTPKTISPAFPFTSQYVDVHGSKMHYVEEGTGDPILFLHGNPTSSYLWRNIIPYLSKHGRAIAPDLIGYGKSDKPVIEYRVFDQIKYIEGFIAALNLTNITLVIHDWGSAIGLHIAMKNPTNIKGIAMMDAHLRPIPTWGDFADDEASIEGFKAFRTPVLGWELIVAQNQFMTHMFPTAMLRKLSPEEFHVYQAPFQTLESRRPIWRLANDIPIEGHPRDTHALFAEYSQKLTQSPLPKLLLHFEPGFVIKGAELAWAKKNLPNLTLVKVGDSVHFVQEDDPHGIGEAIARWYQTLK